jgi:hypothetical protein
MSDYEDIEQMHSFAGSRADSPETPFGYFFTIIDDDGKRKRLARWFASEDERRRYVEQLRVQYGRSVSGNNVDSAVSLRARRARGQ